MFRPIKCDHPEMQHALSAGLGKTTVLSKPAVSSALTFCRKGLRWIGLGTSPGSPNTATTRLPLLSLTGWVSSPRKTMKNVTKLRGTMVHLRLGVLNTSLGGLSERIGRPWHMIATIGASNRIGGHSMIWDVFVFPTGSTANARETIYDTAPYICICFFLSRWPRLL